MENPSQETIDKFREISRCTLTSSIDSRALNWLLDEAPSCFKRDDNSHLKPMPVVGLGEDNHISISWTGTFKLLHADVDMESGEIFWHTLDRESGDTESGTFHIPDGNGWEKLENIVDDVFLSSHLSLA